MDRSHIATEQANPASRDLDLLSIEDAVALMQREDALAVAAVGRAAGAISQAVRMVAAAFTAGGRLIYFGAGTSGRLGVLDASECPPTFCSDPNMVVGVIAGGDQALRRSVENAEDDPAAGAQAVRDLGVTARDIAFGIAAGGTTRYVHGALAEAHARGAQTIFLVCCDPAHVACKPDLFIAVNVGPEVLTGSTRLKAGTATKLVLNTITTLAMVQIGKSLGNQMVDVDAMRNAKLIDRGTRIVSEVAGVSRSQAEALLAQAQGRVKRAIVMHAQKCDSAAADRLLAAHGGRLRPLLHSV